MTFDLDGWRSDRVARFDTWLEGQLGTRWPEWLDAAIAYPLFGGGKRIRPLLAIAAYEATAPIAEDLSLVWPAAAAMELVHTYSLVHDDLPCMDDDDERRGRPTVHRAYDEATAVLVGDALLTQAFGLLARAPWPPPAVVAAVSTLTEHATDMVYGQAADIRWGDRDDTEVDRLTAINQRKTGALIRCACVLGGVAAGAGPVQQQALAAYGSFVGESFQLADDAMDGDGLAARLGSDTARDQAAAASERACREIDSLPRPDALVALARFAAHRSH